MRVRPKSGGTPDPVRAGVERRKTLPKVNEREQIGRGEEN